MKLQSLESAKSVSAENVNEIEQPPRGIIPENTEVSPLENVPQERELMVEQIVNVMKNSVPADAPIQARELMNNVIDKFRRKLLSYSDNTILENPPVRMI